MDTKGGRISMTVNGVVFTSRASAKIDPSTVGLTNGANQNGTGYSTVQPKLAAIEATFDRGKGLKWDASMILKPVDVTFVEDDAGLTHLFTAGRWGGTPQLDTGTGEITGMKIETDQYQSY